MREDLLRGLTQDQIEKVRACDNVSDLLQLAKDEDVELTDEQLAAITGGGCDESQRKRKVES